MDRGKKKEKEKKRKGMKNDLGTSLKMENQLNSIGECKSKWPFGLICNGITFYKVE